MITRRSFVRKTCAACLAIPFASAALTGCSPTHYVTGTLEGNGIAVPLTDFLLSENSTSEYRSSLIVRNEKLEYPIYIYRFSETDYAALLMKCTHQGTELQSSGDQLYCPAHGSEFTNKGDVAQGPAQNKLRTFPVTVTKEKLLVELK